ncbi:putative parvalbumin, EF-hand domain pair [Helianthus annuus]|nr:putative EF-hand domain-containing protein [Helianthus annuus]KAJ0905153.1 putative parvalbumin, EF-hand domain pair [Helianthus annuus]
MEELSKIAMAYYQASTDHLQTLARDFFTAMDHDGEGKIDLREFLEFMKEEGCHHMTNPFMFNQLDLDKNGTLDFVEVMTLYYIIKSGRPFCDHCRKFITSTFLTCVGCLEDPSDRSFHLCLDCYSRQVCDHTHNDMSRFLDNYSLLEAMTKLKIGELRSRPSETDSVVPDKPHSADHNHTWNPSLAMVQVPQRPAPVHNQYWGSQWAPHTSVAPSVHNHTWIQNNYSYNHTPHYHVQQPAPVIPQRQQWQAALGALNAALHISAIGSSFCTIL